MRSPHDNYCTPIIRACQGIFLWYTYSIMLRRTLVFLALAAVATIGVFGSQNAPEKRVTKQSAIAQAEDAARPEQHESSSQNVTVVVPQSTPPANKDHNADSADEDAEIQRKIAYFTKWLAIIAGIQALILGLTVWAIVRQTSTMRAVERAWVLVSIGKIPEFTIDLNLVQFLWISPTIKNHGRTTARIKRIAMRVELVPEGQVLPPVPSYPPGPSFDRTFEFVYPPEMPIQPIPLPVSNDELARVIARDFTLYVHGVVEYLAFGRRLRRSGFCYLYWRQAGFSPVETGFYPDFNAPAAYTECT